MYISNSSRSRWNIFRLELVARKNPHGSHSTLTIQNLTLLWPFSLLLSFGAAKESKGLSALR
jgi:hypothetical protein